MNSTSLEWFMVGIEALAILTAMFFGFVIWIRGYKDNETPRLKNGGPR